jgi:superfamily II DNA or RNA helicase
MSRLIDYMPADAPELWGLRGGKNGYQHRAISSMLRHKRSITVAPAGSGKTIIAARALEVVLRSAARAINVLWLANTNDQLAQGEKALGIIPPEIAAKGSVTFAHPSGLAAVDLATIDLLIVDECHHAAAPTWRAAITGCTNAKIVWGLTATPHREDGLWPEIEDTIGPIACTIERDEVGGGGYTTHGRVEFLVPGQYMGLDKIVKAATFDKETDEEGRSSSFFERMWTKVKWRFRDCDKGQIAKEMETVRRQAENVKVQEIVIANNAVRNAMAAQACRAQAEAGHSVLCLVFSVEQGRSIKEQVPGSALVFSRMTVKNDGRRDDIIQAFRDGTIKVLIATSLADEGLDVPRASCLVLASGGRGISKVEDRDGNKRHSARIEQRTARVLRQFEGKDHGLIIDFYDWQHAFSEAASWTRFQGYRALGFDIIRPAEMQRRGRAAA